MTPDSMVTNYAPAERLDQDAILRQHQEISRTVSLNGLLDSLPTFVLILNEYRQMVYANKAALKFLLVDDTNTLLGKRPGEIVQCVHSSETIGCCGTTEFCRMCGAINAILESQKGQKDLQECRINTMNGTAFDFEVCATPFLTEHGSYTIFSIVDISSEKRRRALERIFFHDITNILVSLRGYVTILNEEKAEDQEEIKNIIDKLTEVLIEEIKSQQILQAAESCDLHLNPDTLHTRLALKDIKKLYENHDLGRNKNIRIDPETYADLFISDRSLFVRVITNMLKNALEASDEGETVTLGCEKHENELRFWVHNRKFIPRDVQLQIFQRSFSTKGSGRGLGTYSIKLLTERYLQGFVSFTSALETGTLFEVRLPLELKPR